MADYISKGFTNDIECPSNTKEMATRFEGMLKKVANMIQNCGPIYHVWITFQLGLNEDDCVIFETDTTNPHQSVIANLDVKKTGANTANSFTLKVIVDPFNFGQETTNQIEKLDELLANALNYNIDDSTNELRGFIQYGYVYPDDMSLASPKYEFFLTSAKSSVKVSSGISTYTFEGTCVICSDCNFTVDIPAVTDTSKTIMQIAVGTVFKYYGTDDNKPNNITDDCEENDFGYIIEVDDELYNDSPTLEDLDIDQIDASSKINPITYMANLLSSYPLTKTELDSGDWDDIDSLSTAEKPGFNWWVDDSNDKRTLHITHYNPNLDETENSNDNGSYEIDYDITWGKQQKNLVLSWDPTVDLYTYLIRKASYIRILKKLENLDEGESIEDYLDNVSSDYKEAILDAYNNDTLDDEQSVVNEYYDATITLIGIPADAPINSYIKIFPRVLESVSRTKGTYMIKGSSDSISTGGTYSTTLELFRLNDATETQDDSGTSSSTTTTTSSSSTTSRGGGSGGGGAR